MSRTHRPRPSFGFVLLTTSWLLLVALLAWGRRTPELERVFSVQQRMGLPGFAGLADEEVALLARSLQRHPELAAAFIGQLPAGLVEPTQMGWLGLERGHLLLQPNPDRTLRLHVDTRGSRDTYPIHVELAGRAIHQTLELAEGERLSLDLEPGRVGAPGLIEVSVGSGAASDPTSPGVQVRFTPELLAEPEVIP